MILVIIFLCLYCVLLVCFHLGWQRAVRDRGNSGVPFYPLISIVVPVRNEEKHIALLLNDLRQQHYGNYEVILVNDHSSDRTRQVAEQNRFPNVSILENMKSGKKGALQTGIMVAKGEIIVTTDADCRVGTHWLECIQKTFVSQEIKFVFGAVGIQSDETFFSRLQAVEFSSLIGSGAATSAFGIPTMCNGANLAFRKETFLHVNGYSGNEHIASGDDEFLMRKVLNAFPGCVKFISYKDASVITTPQRSVSDFVNQRLRWAGKWKHNTSFITILLALFIFSIQLAVLMGAVSLVFSINYSIVILLAAKCALEATFINRVSMFLKIPMSWTAFLALQVLYPFYVLGIGLFSNFTTPVWKDREVNAESITHKT